MFEQLIAMFAYPFLARAVIAGVLISLCAALLGVSLVPRRYSMIGDGLSHVGFGALAIATALNLAPLTVTIPVVILAAFLLLRISERSSIRGDAAVAMISTASLAIGVIAVSITIGINTDVNNYMFGSILTMRGEDVILSVILCFAVLVLYLFFYNKIFAVTFDEAFARATGVRIKTYNAVIAVLTAITIVLGMRMMGALLISSLVIFPALTAMRVCTRFKTVVITAAAISVICFFLGLTLSYLFSLPSGASIVVMNVIAFVLFAAIGAIRRAK